MERSKHLQQPLAIASCKTVSQATNSYSYYAWTLYTGAPRLFAQAKTIYQEFFHQKGGRVPRLAVLVEEMRAGLLLTASADEDQREKDTKTILATYLEFEQEDLPAALQAAAALLYAHDDQLYLERLQPFLRYAQQCEHTPSTTRTPAIELPTCHQQPVGEFTFLSSEVALPSIRHNRRKCAGYLHTLSESDSLPGSLILISAGRVTLDTLQQFADDYSLGTLIVLTLSATVQEELDLRSAAERYIPETIRERIITSLKKLFS